MKRLIYVVFVVANLQDKVPYKSTYEDCINLVRKVICVHYVAEHSKVTKRGWFILPFDSNLLLLLDQRDLRQHTLIHSGERKHICKVCNKAFNRSSNLKVHERIHSGSKPFSCHLCHKAFIQKHVLNSHLKTHPQMLNV